MSPATVWPVLGASPWRFLRSAWPWRSVAYVLSGLAVGPALLVVLAAGTVTGLLTIPLFVGLLVLVAGLLIGVPVAELERRRLRLMVPGLPADVAHRPPARTGPRAWAATRLREPQTWWELGYALLLAGPLWLLDLFVVGAVSLACFIPLAAPWLRTLDGGSMVIMNHLVIRTPSQAWATSAVGLLMLLVAVYVVTAYAGARAALARSLLVPAAPDLQAELVQTTASRARLVNAFEAERRRIERDLHDGAQQQLLRVSVELGLARLEVPDGLADTLLTDRIARAQTHAKQAMTELRGLIHGIQPPVLADRGLPAAVAVAADRLDIPVELDVDVPRRLPAPVESAAYFAVCEALANVGKHSAASRARITGRLRGDLLELEIYDNGVGGADTEAGSGLVGLADRLAVVNGSMRLSSPPGGPTLVRLEIPCPSE